MPTTTNFGWTTPADTDLVKDGAAAIRTALGGVDTSFVDLKGGTTGQVLAKASGTDLDFTWIEQDDTTMSFNDQTGTTYTLVIADLGKWVTASNASPITVTVPPSVFAAGNIVNVQQIGAGQVTFAQGAGVTITSTGASASAPKLRAQYAACTIVCTASDTFTIVGDLA
jgi:archaellum component FlaG (FlaF/FlaG flagellin family)